VKRVCLVSSGTGGHLMPAVTLAQALRRSGHESTLLTEGRVVESELLDRCSEEGDRIPASALQVGRGGLGLPVRLAQATVQARRFMREQKVDLLIGAGGRTTVPASIAARSLGVPVFLLEQNVVTGRANRLLMPLARRIYYGLPPRRAVRRGILTGTPLRPKVGRIDRDRARRSLGLDPLERVVMVTGGSQGARVLNEVVPELLGRVGLPIQVLHLAGPGADQDVRARYCELGVRAVVRPVVMDMASLYSAADLVICRGGGGTIAELMAAGRASIILPYPHHRDRQQWHNGRVLEAAGAAYLRDEADIERGDFTRLVTELLTNPARLRAMGESAIELAQDDACDQIIADLTKMGALD
jgi:UDP-N-acetylglucosamine--N-acetylmuramyl-(pentapeptide) pyrophosphoryl-undecaprenol N-acetylglucosamine transferase